MIGDLNFLNDYDYAEKICNEIIERDLKIAWFCQTKLSLIDKNILDLMSNAGCKMICVGIESGNQELINRANKNIRLENIISLCEMIKQHDIGVFTFWMFGLSDETHETAFDTIKLIKKLLSLNLVDYTHCTVCTPYPGTEIYNNPSKFDIEILTNDFSKFWMGCDYLGTGLPVIKTKYLSEYEIYAYWQLAMATVIGNLK